MEARSSADPQARLAALAGRRRRLAAGQTLFRSGQRSAGPYAVLEGTVRLIRVDAAGREAVLQVAGAGDWLAEASLFAEHYHCDAVAGTAAWVQPYRKAVLLQAFRSDPALAEAFTAMLARQVMALRARLEQRGIHGARDRLRHWLTLNAGSDRRTVELSCTLKDLAGTLGLSHEALYRTLKAMQADGEISRAPGLIRLLAV